MTYINRVLITMLTIVLPYVGISNEVQAKNPWTKCGIGALIFDETSWAAASSNIVWDLGTTAVSSNSSSPGTCNGRGGRTAMYINATYANLEEETVKGEGKHLHAMLTLMGCEGTSHESIMRDIRTDFKTVLNNPAYPDKSKREKSIAYYNLVTDKTNNNKQCQAI